jgi:hypothetical protein
MYVRTLLIPVLLLVYGCGSDTFEFDKTCELMVSCPADAKTPVSGASCTATLFYQNSSEGDSQQVSVSGFMHLPGASLPTAPTAGLPVIDGSICGKINIQEAHESKDDCDGVMFIAVASTPSMN